MIDQIDVLLWRWAQSIHTQISGLGYPGTTIEHRMAREGVIVRTQPQSVTPSFKIDHQIMEVSRAVETMREKWRETIKARYLCGMGEKEGAEYLNISVGSFRRNLDLGHAWLAGRLGIP